MPSSQFRGVQRKALSHSANSRPHALRRSASLHKNCQSSSLVLQGRFRSLNSWFPMRQIDAFQPLRRDCAKLRDRKMSRIVSKRRAAVFLSYVWFDRCTNLILWEKHGRPTFWHYSRYSTMSQSCATSSRRPKYANLARAGTNAYETVGNRPVNKKLLSEEVIITL